MRTNKKVIHINILVTTGPSIHELLFSENSEVNDFSVVAVSVDQLDLGLPKCRGYSRTSERPVEEPPQTSFFQA
jgi:hypothetical protein